MKGFIDLQVNGYSGIDFSSPDLTLDQVYSVVHALCRRGTLAFCPTLVTSSRESYRHTLPILADAMRVPELSRHLLGIHLEGPFISPLDGARGAHSKEHVALPDIGFFEELRSWADDRVVLLTVAPELEGSMELIRHVTGSGIPVSLGHHLADAETIAEACRSGACAATHLGNGIPNLLPRHPNPLWDQLARPELTVMLITDGHHLPESFIRVASHLKAPEQLIVVSDCAPIAGFPPGRYQTLGQEVILEELGRLWNPIGNHLVGSSACMLDCMNYLASLEDLGLEALCQVGYQNPLRLLRRQLDEDVYDDLPELLYEGGRFRLPK